MRKLSFGLFFAITCNDDVAFLREEDIERETRGTFLRRLSRPPAAGRMPRTGRKFRRRRTARPRSRRCPALFVSGANDAASPLWFTQRVAPNYSERAEVVVVGHGHTEWNDCVVGIWEQLVRDGSVRGVPRQDLRCRAAPAVQDAVGRASARLIRVTSSRIG